MHASNTGTASRRADAAWLVFAIAWALLIAWLTLRSNPLAAALVARDHWYCVVCGESGLADVILNLILYFPLGAALHALRWPLWRAALLMCAATLCIEVTQAHWLIGRDGTLGDVLMNSAGGLLGWLSFPAMRAIARPTRAVASVGALITVAVTTAVWFASGLALQPALSDAAPWIGQPLHQWPGLRHFPGRIASATVDGISVGNAELSSTPQWRDSIVVRLLLASDSVWTDGQEASLIRIIDAAGVTQVDVNQVGADALVDLHLRGSAWLLHTPKWRVADAFSSAGGEPWQFIWRWERDRIVISSGAAGATPIFHAVERLRASEGWAFIHPFTNTVDAHAALWTALWLAWWFGLLGWFAGFLDRHWPFAVGALALIGFVVATIVTGMSLAASDLAIGAIAYIAFVFAARTRRNRTVAPVTW
jgi:hypothetical protein